MLTTDLINLASLIDDAKCFDLICQQRWPNGVRCVKYCGGTVVRHGHDDTQRHRQRYRAKTVMFALMISLGLFFLGVISHCWCGSLLVLHWTEPIQLPDRQRIGSERG